MIEPSPIAAANDPAGNTLFRRSLDHSIMEFVRYLLGKWWIFLLIAIVAGVLGIMYAARQQVKYESRLTFVLDQGGGDGGVSSAVSLAAQFGLNINSGDDLFSGDNILEIMKSRRIVEKVLLTTDTFNNKPYTLIEYFLYGLKNDRPGDKDDKKDTVHFFPNQQRTSLSYAQDSVLYHTYLDFVTTNINADRPDKKLNIFSLQITSEDEKFSKVFTDRLIHETDSFYTEISSKKERETLEILEQRVASMRGNLSSSIADRAATQDANVNPAFASASVPVQKQQANIQVYGGAYAEMFKNLELARFQYLKKIPLIQIIDEANYPMKKIKMGKLKTGLIFSFASVFIAIFILWVVRIYKLIV